MTSIKLKLLILIGVLIIISLVAIGLIWVTELSLAIKIIQTVICASACIVWGINFVYVWNNLK